MIPPSDSEVIQQEARFLEEYASMAEVALDAVISIDSEGIVRAWNPMAKTTFGWTKREAIGRPLVDLIIPLEYREAHLEGLKRFLSTEKGPVLRKRFEITGQDKSGEQFPVELAISPVKGGDKWYFTAFVRDIRERIAIQKQLEETAAELDRRVNERTSELESKNRLLAAAEQEARQGKQELQDYIDSMTTLNAKVSLDGVLLLVNKAAQIGSAVPMDELIGSKFLELEWCSFDPEVQARVSAAFNRACQGESVRYEESVVLQNQQTTISFNLVPVKDTNGKVLYVVAEGRDISERKAIEDEILEKTALLEASNRELEAFSYSVSHDLRGPLRSIDGFSHALMEDYGTTLDPEALEFLQRIRASAQKMAQLIDDLLNLSRLTRMALHREKLDLSTMAREIASDLESREPDRKVAFQIADNIGASADPTLVQALLSNLMSNAWKFTAIRTTSEIELGAKRQKEGTVYYVKDNGVGFDMAYAGKLFGAFERLHSPKEYPGSGIGLATASRIVGRHGGKIWAESSVDNGATFFFTLPPGKSAGN